MLTDLPNLLTLSRIGAIPVLVALVAVRHPGTDLAACLVFSAAGDHRLAATAFSPASAASSPTLGGCWTRSRTSCWSVRP